MATYGSYKKIRNDSIVASSLTASQIANNTITNASIANNAVGTTQLASTLDLSGKTMTYRPLVNGDLGGAISTSKISGLATSATTDTTNAANITSGTVSSSLISTLTASKLTGALPAVSGASLTRGGKKFECFYYGIDNISNTSDGGTLATFTFTTTFTGNIHMGWSLKLI